jgi:hypothetical protein
VSDERSWQCSDEGFSYRSSAVYEDSLTRNEAPFSSDNGKSMDAAISIGRARCMGTIDEYSSRVRIRIASQLVSGAQKSTP